jgi:hypothetical protein
MKSDVRKDFEWQSSFCPSIKRIVGPHLLEPSPLELDLHEATDLLVLRARDMRIGCRIRRAGYAERYPWDFTLRSLRDSGATTELAKIVDGWGDWFFYGHEERFAFEDWAIDRWFLIDLHAWRAQVIRKRININAHIPNGDGTFFVAFDLREFDESPPICVASSHKVPRRIRDDEFRDAI